MCLRQKPSDTRTFNQYFNIRKVAEYDTFLKATALKYKEILMFTKEQAQNLF